MTYDWFIAPIAHALPRDPSTVVTLIPTGPLAVTALAAACDGDGALVVGDPEGDLDSAQREAASIANRLAGQMAVSVLANSDATRDAVAQSMRGKRFLHFASHATFDEEDDASEHGVLSLADGDLTAADIRAIPIDAELVVLSACDTGQGRIAADNVLGLARSFIVAGACSVIATLWEVPDGPSYRPIEHFYTRLAVHRDKALALREAMRHVKAIPGYEDPYLWAGFVLIGHPR